MSNFDLLIADDFAQTRQTLYRVTNSLVPELTKTRVCNAQQAKLYFDNPFILAKMDKDLKRSLKAILDHCDAIFKTPVATPGK